MIFLSLSQAKVGFVSSLEGTVWRNHICLFNVERTLGMVHCRVVSMNSGGLCPNMEVKHGHAGDW